MNTDTRIAIPLFMGHVAAGFPNPADSYIEQVIDLNELVIRDKDLTYFVYVESDSMIEEHIVPGGWLIVDKGLIPENGDMIVAWVNGGFTVKRVQIVSESLLILHPANPNYAPIIVHEGEDYWLFGKVTFFFFEPPKYPIYGDWNR
ncbi:LexA family protein [Spirosoma terrae]|uniref:Translesion error-prone DNA polymerase V autoproteolytic subunit n=1 Tax=Spirosoma terrae TaxID=1968276 RepID=A0A6L9L576_9BACT|nr:translesion error-prone DNA polymerase V autoproteolytic subunit [Spirosoma terrae]NDU95775.1 translesion error-prone DNA polymerase V autoproteolytic subunit [Spirosoma terrae]